MMRTGLAFPAMCLFAAALSGCSDGGGGSSAEPDSFVELSDQAFDLVDEIESLEETDPAALPTAGSASYDGVMVIDSSDGNTLAGDMQLDVNFARSDDAITGSVENIVDVEENLFEGSLAISDGDIDRDRDDVDDPVFTADIDGVITGPDSVSYDVDGGLDGTFIGNDADYAAGLVDGTACSGASCLGLEGVFITRD